MGLMLERMTEPVEPTPLQEALARVRVLENAIKEHHAQKADDRCIDDDARLYAAAGLPPHDARVGDKTEMLINCARFIENRCQEGHWPTYKQLEQTIDGLQAENRTLRLLCQQRAPG